MRKKLLIGLMPLVAYAAMATVPVASQAAACKKFVVGKVPHYCANGVRLEEYPSAATEKTPTISWAKLSLGGASGVQCKNAVGGNVWNPTVSATGTPAYPSNTTGQAEQETLEFTTYECSLPAATCPLEARVIAENLPWTGIVREGKPPDPAGTLRLQNNGVRVSVGCFLPLGAGPGEGEPFPFPSTFPSLNTSGGPGTPGNGENFGQLKLGSSKCNAPGTTLFGPKSATSEGSGELEQEIPTAEALSEAPGTHPGAEGRGKLLFQSNGSDILKSETGVGIGVKAVTEGTVKTCGFLNQELINTEE